jgi:tryptophan synthase alpha chain
MIISKGNGMSLSKLFETKKSNILSVYFTAGFPMLEDTTIIAKHLEDAGADIIEIGIPFSDPIADGPVIQESNNVALANGMTVKKLLAQVVEIRKEVSIPIILMGYINPVLQYGIERFCKEASAAGVNGLILPDMPMDEYQKTFKPLFDKTGLSNTFLISPTTSEARIKRIDDATTSFIYAVSSSSTTGAKSGFAGEQIDYFARLKAMELKNPFLVGFGISNHQSFSKVCEYGAGAIVGSAFITMLKNSKDLKTDIQLFVKSIVQ